MGEKEVSKEGDQQKEASVKICRVKLNVSNPDRDYISAVKLRGFLGSLFVDDAEFHHHSERSYHYPLIQYKRVNSELMILGLQEYAMFL